MEDVTILKNKVRKYNPETDDKLPVVSYSKLDLSDQCMYRYNLKYNLENYAPQSSIALDLGSLIHKCVELKQRMIMKDPSVSSDKGIDYDYIRSVLMDGIVEKTDKGVETILGVEDIKKKFGFEIWYEPDNKSGMNYDQKIQKFLTEVLPNRFEDRSIWTPFATELSFDFVYNYGTEKKPKEVKIHGFIDSVLVDDVINPARFKVIDFKTSKAIYDKSKTATSAQQGIYGLALYVLYGILPEEYEYDFVLINQTQKANTKGYLKRLLKKLDKILQNIEDCDKSKVYKPKPCPLCYFCDFGELNPNATEPYKYMCEYYSLWQPNKPSFAVNKQWGEEDTTTPAPEKRKLIF